MIRKPPRGCAHTWGGSYSSITEGIVEAGPTMVVVEMKTTRLIQKTAVEFMNEFIQGNQKERGIDNKSKFFAYAVGVEVTFIR